MNNTQKISSMIALSQLMDNISFSVVQIPSLGGTKVYCFKSKDGRLDFTYNPKEDNDANFAFNRMLNIACRKFLPGEILDGEPTPSILASIFTKIKDEHRKTAKTVEHYTKQKLTPRMSYIYTFSHLDNAYADLYKDMNIGSKNEDLILGGVRSIYNMLAHEDPNANVTAMDLQYTLDVRDTHVTFHRETNLPKWAIAENTPASDEVEKLRARALTLAFMGSEFLDTAILQSPVDNAQGVRINSHSGESFTSIFHEKENKLDEALELEKFILDGIAKGIEADGVELPTDPAKRRDAIYDQLSYRQFPEQFLTPFFENQVLKERNTRNVTDTRVYDTVALNLASLSNFPLDNSASITDKIIRNPERLHQAFDTNYNTIKTNPKSIKESVDFIRSSREVSKIFNCPDIFRTSVYVPRDEESDQQEDTELDSVDLVAFAKKFKLDNRKLSSETLLELYMRFKEYENNPNSTDDPSQDILTCGNELSEMKKSGNLSNVNPANISIANIRVKMHNGNIVNYSITQSDLNAFCDLHRINPTNIQNKKRLVELCIKYYLYENGLSEYNPTDDIVEFIALEASSEGDDPDEPPTP